MYIKMNQNTFERFARIVIGGAFLVLVTYVPMNRLLSVALVILGLVLMLTGLSGRSPLYSLFGISTKR